MRWKQGAAFYNKNPSRRSFSVSTNYSRYNTRSKRLSSAAPDDLPKQSATSRSEPERSGHGGIRRAGIARHVAGFAGRLPHDRRGRRGALRRQGGRPEKARLVVFSETAARPAHRHDADAGRGGRDHGHALRSGGADPREQSHQVARPPLQHPVPRRQGVSLPDGDPRGESPPPAFSP